MPPRPRLLQWLLWAACGLAALGAVAVLLLPLGGTNRIGIAALPFAVGAAALAVLALYSSLDRRLVMLIYAIAAIALVYGLMEVASVPLRLAVEGNCPASIKSCPVGFERPMTGGESAALDTGVALVLVSVVAAMAALEVQFRPRLRLIGRDARPVEQPAPPPEMKPSAIVRKPATDDKPS